MAINFTRDEYTAALPNWQLVDACCEETGLDDLLIEINPLDTTDANRQRNTEYKDRASWFGASAFTEMGLIGTAFDDPPAIELPPLLDALRTNVDGQGVDLQQQIQATMRQVLRKGRCGLFVTYPQSEGDTSKADQMAGKIRATIHRIDADRVINWWLVSDGADVKLGGVVFTDVREAVEDYEVKKTTILRHLELVDGAAVDRVWVRVRDQWTVETETVIRDGDGVTWDVLPFTFVGALDNTASIDRPPMLPLARLNRDHYRNSADYEESTFYAGSPQPWVKGWHVEDIEAATARGFRLGSREVIACDQFAFAQPSANPESRIAMQDKEGRMKAIGARFLEPGTVAKTATEAAGDQRVQHSVLSLTAQNVEDAYNTALAWCGRYERTADADAFVTLSREYMRRDVAAEKIAAFLNLWDRALVGPEEAHRVLTGANIVDPDKPAEDYADELAQRGALAEPIGADGGDA